MSEADVENGDHVGLLAQKPNPGLKFDKKLSETERSTRVRYDQTSGQGRSLVNAKTRKFYYHIVFRWIICVCLCFFVWCMLLIISDLGLCYLENSYNKSIKMSRFFWESGETFSY